MKTIEDVGSVIYTCYSGSTSYGTNITEELALELVQERGGKVEDYISDTDIRGIFIPHPQFLYGTQRVDEFEDPTEEDMKFFSLQKFVNLAIEGNPNVVEQLFVNDEHVLFESEIGKELREKRHWFLTRNCFGRFASYANAQLKRMEPKVQEFKRNEKRQKFIDDTGGWDPKNAAHLIRLFEMGIQILREGDLSTLRPNHKMLLDIRLGKWTLEEVKAYAEKLDKELRKAMEMSPIPETPDFDEINKWVVSVTNKVHGLEFKNATFHSSSLKILPETYEMVDKTTLFLVSNPLVRKKDKAKSFGLCIPHQDWFTGLRDFREFKFDETTIEHIHKFAQQVEACNPKHIDAVFASNDKFIHKHSLTSELLAYFKTLPTLKRAFYTAKGFSEGNLKKMEQWEKLKAEHSAYKEDVKEAKKLTNEDWNTFMNELETTKDSFSKNDFQYEKDKLIKKHQRWKELVYKKGNIPYYPPVPDKTPNENASLMTKFGYDTLLGAQIVHVLRMYTELIKKGTIKNSRLYEREMYDIKHGEYKTFSLFQKHVKELFKELNEAKENAVLKNNNKKDDSFLIEYIQLFYKML